MGQFLAFQFSKSFFHLVKYFKALFFHHELSLYLDQLHQEFQDKYLFKALKFFHLCQYYYPLVLMCNLYVNFDFRNLCLCNTLMKSVISKLVILLFFIFPPRNLFHPQESKQKSHLNLRLNKECRVSFLEKLCSLHGRLTILS